MADPFPSYSPDKGLSEWGMGWGASLSIHRWRALGSLDFTTDDLNGPWGRMVQGSDGAWYPSGLSAPVRVESAGAGLVALLPDGSRWMFGTQTRVETPRGTYAWFLQEVRDATGRRTRFSYTANGSGRPFLQTVESGGRGEDFQYRVELAYAPLAQAFVDYRSGVPLVLDQRVSEVRVLARDRSSGAFGARWRYSLTYQEDDAGPAFYLARVQQLFASGEASPPVVYTHASPAEPLATVKFQPLPSLDTALALFGEDVIQPGDSSLLDINLDGRPDLEHSLRQTLLVQEDAGFQAVELPPAGPGAVEECRPAAHVLNEPRHLVQLWADKDEHQVVDVRSSWPYANTEFTVCDREGRLLAQQTLPGDWSLGNNSRLVDLDQDRQPDLIRVYAGGYDILPNASSGTAFAVAPVRSGGLMPYFTPHTTWVQDMNGDGLVDLVARYDGGLAVWYGKGSFEFDAVGQSMPAYFWFGAELTGFLDYQLSFVDVNRDGLTDLLATQSGWTTLFVNTGVSFVETVFAGQDFFDGYAGPVVVADLGGTGGTQLISVKWGKAHALTLDAPGTGLMRTAEDGKGTRLHFDYRWSKPVPGARQRQAVLSEVTTESSGQTPAHSTFTYAQPVLHPQGRFLLGYGQVTLKSPALTEEVSFLHDEHQAGVLSASTTRDLHNPGVLRYESHAYDGALFQGLPWKRLKESRKGWRAEAEGPALEERTEYLGYEAERCPSRLRLQTAHGTLTTERHRATVPALSRHLHCLEDTLVLEGKHPQASLDFRHEARLSRNAVGLLERLESIGPQGPLTLQELVYRPDFTVASLSVPGRGTTHFDFEPGGFLLRKVTAPVGSAVEVTERAPLTDSILTLSNHTGGQSHTQFFRYDGQERLSRQWDSLGNTSETHPALTLAYEYATALEPAAIHVTTRVQSLTGSTRRVVEWFTAAGESVAIGQRIPEGWSLDGVISRDRELLENRTYQRPTLPASTAVEGLTYDALLTGAWQVGTTRFSGFGPERQVLSRFHADVERQRTSVLAMVAGGLQRETVENGTQRTRHGLDTAQRIVSYEDPSQVRYTYTYDALGRLRGVVLPDGKRHQVSFDAHGRVARVEREGIATLAYAYAPGTGLLTSRLFLSPSGMAQRSEEWAYDALGRKTAETHTALASGATQQYRFFYDGATPEQPSRRTHWGVTSAIQGEGYLKTFEYRPDGKLTRRVLRLGGWRTVESQFVYTDSGEVQEANSVVRTLDGVVVSTSSKTQAWDAHGRLAGVLLNGAPLATFHYDASGLSVLASFATGDSVALGYDALTRQRVSLAHATPGWTASSSVRFNERGFPGTESFSVAGRHLLRRYDYSPQGFLTSAQDPEHAYTYAFDDSGLPAVIEEQGVRRTLVAQGNTLSAGEVQYTFDALGRTVTKGDLTFFYGPNGHLERAVRGDSEWRFLHDETGQRLLKLSGDVPVAAYLEGGGYLDASGLTEPFLFGGQLVGLVQGNHFQPLATDVRGTVMADADGNARLASPFGHRDVHPANSAIVDYVRKGFDADLGLIRMGIRDYDPSLNRFMTPDPLFLADPSLCVCSPVECNLYGYAGGNPVAYVDPTGEALETVWDAASLAMGIASIASWDENTSTTDKVLDVVGVVVDGAALALPFVPGGAGAILKGARAADKAVGAVQAADKAQDGAKLVWKADDAAAKIIPDVSADASKAAGSSGNAAQANPLAGVTYTGKVRSQIRPNLKTGRPDDHGFPLEVDNFAGSGRQTTITGGDGVNRMKIELDGSYNGKHGKFEWIVEPNGTVNHRLFVPTSRGAL
ncbi:RHS repeat-associated core domain-containing protein [Stigmatella aurantiaca]|uniref:RHS repeat-associated core domain-containing protein n=1 Tax=Stigmatella aurantiaca TaxID=41 RepID=UPI000941DC39|nr:RHS repeat-associated core domain-containing protein [Stigmatella aurantiaca]